MTSNLNVENKQYLIKKCVSYLNKIEVHLKILNFLNLAKILWFK